MDDRIADIEGWGGTTSRPRSVTILGILHILQSLSLLAFGIYQVARHGWLIGEVEIGLLRVIPFPMLESMANGAISVVFGVVSFFIAIALLRLRSWAWVAAMAIQGFGLFAALIGYLRARPNYVGMVFGIFLVFYLNQREIQLAFRSRQTNMGQ